MVDLSLHNKCINVGACATTLSQATLIFMHNARIIHLYEDMPDVASFIVENTSQFPMSNTFMPEK